jgi:hypothetical protein
MLLLRRFSGSVHLYLFLCFSSALEIEEAVFVSKGLAACDRSLDVNMRIAPVRRSHLQSVPHRKHITSPLQSPTG